jgi:hypothetical protein
VRGRVCAGALEPITGQSTGTSSRRALPAYWLPVTSNVRQLDMDDELVQALRRTIERCGTREELEQRIVLSFGRAKLSEALLLAAEMKGLDWMRPNQRLEIVDLRTKSQRGSSYSVGRWIGTMFRFPSLVVLFGGTVGVGLILLFPPYVVPFQQGLVQNAGFAPVWNPPQYGNLHAVVNVPLLAVLIAGIVVVTAGLYLGCSRIESERRSAPGAA